MNTPLLTTIAIMLAAVTGACSPNGGSQPTAEPPTVTQTLPTAGYFTQRLGCEPGGHVDAPEVSATTPQRTERRFLAMNPTVRVEEATRVDPSYTAPNAYRVYLVYERKTGRGIGVANMYASPDGESYNMGLYTVCF